MNHFIPQVKLLLLKSPLVAMVSVKLIIKIWCLKHPLNNYAMIWNSLSYFVLLEAREKEGWGRLEEVAFWSKQASDPTKNKIQLPPFMTHTLDEVQEILFCSILIRVIEVSGIHRQ